MQDGSSYVQMELDLQLEDRGEGAIDGSLDFSTDLYTSESAGRMAGHLQVRGSCHCTPQEAHQVIVAFKVRVPVAMHHVYEVALCRHYTLPRL